MRKFRMTFLADFIILILLTLPSSVLAQSSKILPPIEEVLSAYEKNGTAGVLEYSKNNEIHIRDSSIMVDIEIEIYPLKGILEFFDEIEKFQGEFVRYKMICGTENRKCQHLYMTLIPVNALPKISANKVVISIKNISDGDRNLLQKKTTENISIEQIWEKYKKDLLEREYITAQRHREVPAFDEWTKLHTFTPVTLEGVYKLFPNYKFFYHKSDLGYTEVYAINENGIITCMMNEHLSDDAYHRMVSYSLFLRSRRIKVTTPEEAIALTQITQQLQSPVLEENLSEKSSQYKAQKSGAIWVIDHPFETITCGTSALLLSGAWEIEVDPENFVKEVRLQNRSSLTKELMKDIDWQKIDNFPK